MTQPQYARKGSGTIADPFVIIELGQPSFAEVEQHIAKVGIDQDPQPCTTKQEK